MAKQTRTLKVGDLIDGRMKILSIGMAQQGNGPRVPVVKVELDITPPATRQSAPREEIRRV